MDPVDVVIQFFESAPLEQAQTVLTIARGILARRTPKAKAAKPARKSATQRTTVPPTLDSEWGGENDRTHYLAETVPPHVKTTRGGLAVTEDDRS